MFPWSWIFVWAPRWPACGDVSYGDWTNSLFSVRQAVAMAELLEFVKLTLKHDPKAVTRLPVFAMDSSEKENRLRENIQVLENLLDRAGTRTG